MLSAKAALGSPQMLNGHILDSRTHQGTPNARIELAYLGVNTGLEYSDSDGAFSFNHVEPRNYTISVELPGYVRQEVLVDSNQQHHVDVELRRTTDAAVTSKLPATVSVREYMTPKAALDEFKRAEKFIERKDCSKAIEHLENGLRLYAHNASALNDLGNCRRRLGNYEGAEAAFKQAMALSDNAFFAMNLAETYTAQQRFSDAEAVLVEALQKDPASGDLYYSLAAAYFKQGRFEDAEGAALQADSRIHHISDLHLLLAKIYAQTDSEKTVTQLELYLKEAPSGSQSKRVREVIEEAKRAKSS